jgi:hypothetical protein
MPSMDAWRDGWMDGWKASRKMIATSFTICNICKNLSVLTLKRQFFKPFNIFWKKKFENY